ncbi:MAG: hypothetical protein ACTTI3_09335 [Treponema sp.]
MLKAATKQKGGAIPRISSYSILLPYLIVPFRVKSARALFRFLRTVIRDFFWLQFSVKWHLKNIPILDVSHSLDEVIPFTPEKVGIYLNFVNFWIHPMAFLLRRFGIRKALPYCTEYLVLIETAYRSASLIYRFCMTTTDRPHYTANKAFRNIHRFDPHLLCVPSLHVAIAILACVYYSKAFEELGLSGDELGVYKAELKADACEIIESVLYIKQHSVNCIAAALYMMLYLSKDDFTVSAGTEIIDSLFVNDSLLAKKDKQAVRDYIHFMFERFLLEGLHEDDWTIPIKHWLCSYAQSKHIKLDMVKDRLHGSSQRTAFIR